MKAEDMNMLAKDFSKPSATCGTGNEDSSNIIRSGGVEIVYDTSTDG